MDTYLNSIGAVDLLDAAQERDLSRAIRRGRAALAQLDDEQMPRKERARLRRVARDGERAADRFYLANLRLVVSVARRYPVPPGMEFADLVQEGNMGLRRAVEKFDGRKGFKFSTYATFWIRQAISKAIDGKSHVLSVSANRASEMRHELRVSGGNAHALTEHNALAYHASSPMSLDSAATNSDDQGSSLVEVVADPRAVDPEAEAEVEARRALVERMLDDFDPHTQLILRLRFGIDGDRPRAYTEIADVVGISGEMVRRRAAAAVDEMRRRASSGHYVPLGAAELALAT